MKYIFLPHPYWSQPVRTGWVRWGDPSLRTNCQSSARISRTRIADSVLPCFQTSQRAMADTLERWAIKFCTKLEKKAAETHEFLKQAFGESTLSYVQVWRWVKKFKEGQEGVDDDLRSGRPTTSQTDENVTRVSDLLNSDRRMSVRLLADTEHSEKCCASHRYGRIEHAKGVRQAGPKIVDGRAKGQSSIDR